MGQTVAGDVTIDVSSGPYESGFKFNTIPFGGMTVTTGNAVRIGSPSTVNLVPFTNNGIFIGTTTSTPGSQPSPTTPPASMQGWLFLVPAVPGTSADKLYVCLQSNAAIPSYSWQLLASG